MILSACWLQTVLIFSAVGIPLSTTHCAVGSTVGVGLLEPQEKQLPFREGITRCPPRFPCINTGSVNWKLFGGMMASWVVTILFSCEFASAERQRGTQAARSCSHIGVWEGSSPLVLWANHSRCAALRVHAAIVSAALFSFAAYSPRVAF